MPRVFISYSWDNEKYKDRVRAIWPTPPLSLTPPTRVSSGAARPATAGSVPAGGFGA